MKSRFSKKQIAGTVMAVFLSLNSTISGFAQDSGWHKDEMTKRWWYSVSDGTFYRSSWQWIDGNGDGIAECYYFDSDGYLYTDWITPDGFTVNADGAWTVDNIVQQRKVQELNVEQSKVSTTPVLGINDTSQEEYLSNKEAYRDEVLRLVNRYRKKLGKPALEKDENLQNLAQIRAEEISELYSHTRPGTGEPLHWQDGVNGEVIMRLVKIPDGAFSAWTHSKGHDKLLKEKSFKRAGVGYYVTEDGKQYWVMLFAI